MAITTTTKDHRIRARSHNIITKHRQLAAINAFQPSAPTPKTQGQLEKPGYRQRVGRWTLEPGTQWLTRRTRSRSPIQLLGNGQKWLVDNHDISPEQQPTQNRNVVNATNGMLAIGTAGTGDTMLSPAGTRKITTFRKLPMQAPISPHASG